jgi:hypothetical protein
MVGYSLLCLGNLILEPLNRYLPPSKLILEGRKSSGNKKHLLAADADIDIDLYILDDGVGEIRVGETSSSTSLPDASGFPARPCLGRSATVKARPAGLMPGENQRFEAAVPVTWNLNRQFSIYSIVKLSSTTANHFTQSSLRY